MGHPPAVPVPDACSQYLVFVDTPECRDPAFDECPRWGMPSFTCDLPGAVEAGELAGGTQLSPVLRGLSAGTQSLLRSRFRAPPRCAGHGAGNIYAAREPRRAPRRHGAHVRRPPVRGARVTAGSPDTAPSGTAVRVKLGRHRPACPSTCATSASGPMGLTGLTGLTCPRLPSPVLTCPHLPSPVLSRLPPVTLSPPRVARLFVLRPECFREVSDERRQDAASRGGAFQGGRVSVPSPHRL